MRLGFLKRGFEVTPGVFRLLFTAKKELVFGSLPKERTEDSLT